MPEALDVYLFGQRAATLERRARGQYRLQYTEEWQHTPAAVPLSTQLPVQPKAHTGERLLRVLEGFLPDRDDVLRRWATAAGLPDTEAFGLLEHYGEDVAGAVVFTPAGRPPVESGSLIPLSDQQIAARIRGVRTDPRSWVADRQDHRFSLAGMQGKFALAQSDQTWFEPDGATPSTHIFKPGIEGYPDSEILEHIVMSVARRIGIPAAETRIDTFEDEHALVVTRFDRLRHGDAVLRLHQEDLAQATGTSPGLKYEADGGPGIAGIVRVLRREVSPELLENSLAAFGASLVFAWLLAHNDGHAKNYSLRLLPGQFELTPLYDLNSYLPYLDPRRLEARDSDYAHEVELAFSIDGRRRIGELLRAEWNSLEHSLGLPPDALVDFGLTASEALMQVINEVIDELPESLRTPTVDRFRTGAFLRQKSARVALAKRV